MAVEYKLLCEIPYSPTSISYKKSFGLQIEVDPICKQFALPYRYESV